MSNEQGGGLLILENSSLKVSNISFSISADGRVEASPIRVETEIDMCPHWIDIALEQLAASERAHAEALSAANDDDSQSLGKALKQEFRASLQTITASVTALDAHYSSVKRHISLPEGTEQAWRSQGLARYKQMAEVFKRAFAPDDAKFRGIREGLGTAQKYRDWAVHPPSGPGKPVRYDEINRGVDWRLVAFRYENAKKIAHLALNFIAGMVITRPDNASDGLKTYCARIAKQIEPAVAEWERRYGPDDLLITHAAVLRDIEASSRGKEQA